MGDHRLLIVDDDAQICALIQDVGETCGYQVIALTRADEFRTTYTSFQPTFIILDLNLENSDGVELLRVLAAEKCSVPIVLMSGHDEKVLSTALRLGKTHGLQMVKSLKKPIKVAEFVKLLNAAKQALISPSVDSLVRAVQEYNFVLHYQPKLHIKTRKLVAVEALVRWQAPNHELIFPDAFISLAEQTGLIEPLTRWVIRNSLAQSAAWKKNNIDLIMQINLSPKFLTDLSLPDELIRQIKEFDLEPSKVGFEITETAVMAQPTAAMEILTRMRIKGLLLAIDDFGTGYSSLVALHRMPFSELKIDKSFIIDMAEDIESRVIARALIELGHNLGMSMVAEGVETKRALAILEELGCDIAQGYYVSRPIDADKFMEWVKTSLDKDLRFIGKDNEGALLTSKDNDMGGEDA